MSDMRVIWAEQIKRSARILADASEEEIATLSPTALMDLNYWMVSAADAINYWRSQK